MGVILLARWLGNGRLLIQEGAGELRLAGMGGFAADYGFETEPHALSLKRLVALPAQANQKGKVCDRYQR